MKSILSFFLILLFVHPTWAQTSWFDKKIDKTRLFDKFLSAGVPELALQRTFEFLDINGQKNFVIKVNGKPTIKSVANKNYAAIIDFSKPSTERRLYFMDLKKGRVEKYYVAHGLNTGETEADRFSNKPDSKKTSLGLYLDGF